MKHTLKKSLAVILASATILCCAPLSGIADLDLPEFGGFKKLASSVSDFFDGLAPKAEAEISGISGYYTYTVSSNGEATITTVNLSISGDVVIPSTLGGYPVTRIGGIYYRAFKGCKKITSIIIPNSVTSIFGNAFEDCESLTSITIPDSVTSISSSAFYNTGIYNNESNWENDVLYIGNYLIGAKNTLSGTYSVKDGTKVIASSAFSDRDSLTSITISDSVTNIGDNAFCFCDSLTSVTIPDSVTSIGDFVFDYCASLTSITIPDSVTSIGYKAFEDCTSLTSIKIGDSVTSISRSAFYNTGIYNNESNWENDVLYIGNYLIGAKNTLFGTYSVKDGTKVIADNAFSGCQNLTSITISNSVTSIGDSAFRDCANLTSITIPDSVTSIGDFAFVHCANLTSITIGNSVTSIGDYAFSSCTSLTSITIPDSVTIIGDYGFNGCDSLTNVYYTGTEAEWNAILIDSYNKALTNATIHFNYVPEKTEKEYIAKWIVDGHMVKVLSVPEGTAISSPENPVKEGYEFLGWTPEVPETMPPQHMTFVAVWKETSNREDTLMCYAGPGMQYEFLGEKSVSNYAPICLENGYYEIEGKINNAVSRIYVKKSDVEFEKDIPVVIDSTEISTNISKEKYIYKVSVTHKTIQDTKIYSGPSNKYTVRDVIPSGENITFLYSEKNGLNNYYLIEYNNGNGSFKRGYVSEFVLNDIKGNPLRFLNNIKSSNAAFIFNGNTLYSASRSVDSEKFKSLGSAWNCEQSINLSFMKVDFLAGATAAISSNGPDAEINWGGNNPYYNKSGGSKAVTLMDGFNTLVTFFSSSLQQTVLKANIEEFRGERQLVLFMGTPIEAPYAGQKTTLGAELFKPGLYLTSADEVIRKSFKGLKDYGKYSMNITFSKDFSSCPYGYSLVIKKDGSVIAYPIIHSGTSMPVYHTYNGKTEFVFDAASLYATTGVELDDEISKIIFKKLEEKGIISTYQKVEIKCPTDVTIYDLDDNIIAQSVNNFFVTDKNDEVAVDTIGTTKIIRFPINTYHRISTVANSDGSMDYTVSNIEYMEEKNRINKFNIPLEQGDIFLGNSSENGMYSLRKQESGECLIFENLNSSETINCNLLVVSSENGSIIGVPPSVICGDTITLSAIPNVGSSFGEWIYNGEKLDCSSETISLVIKSDTTIEAKFFATEKVLSSLNIYSMPFKTEYLIEEELVLEGMVLQATYSDGSVDYIDSGFEVSVSDDFSTPGNKDVVVNYADKSSSFVVTVNDSLKINEIILSLTDVSLSPNEEVELHCSFLPNNAHSKILWTSTNNDVASVDLNGSVVAKNTGSCEIRATSLTGGIVAVCKVVVSESQNELYKIKYIVDGTIFAEDVCEVGHNIVSPSPPCKEGYKFVGWTPAIPTTMPASDLTFTAVYEATGTVSQDVVNKPSQTTISYGDAIILHVDESKIPEGGRVEWTSSNGNFSYKANGATCEIRPEKSGDTTFTATIYDVNGNPVLTDEQTMTSKAGFFDKIIAFFKGLFGLSKTYPNVFKGIF